MKKQKLNIEQKISAILSGIFFYCDKLDRKVFYAEYIIRNNVLVFTPIDSSDFKSYIRITAWRLKHFDVTAEKVIEYIKDVFTVENPPPSIDAYVRVAGNLKKGIEYSLNDEHQRIVHIDKTGWALNSASTYKFISYSHMQPQVEPVHTSKSLLELIKPYVNLRGDDLVLFVTWLVQSFSTGDHNALLVSAEKGCGKTALSKLVRKLIDPSTLDVTVFPTKEDDLCTVLTNTFFVAFDNLNGSNLSRNISDILCTAVTGATKTKRSLYTTNELSVFRLHNAILLNGLPLTPAQSDLAERLLLIKLPKISAKNRMDISEMWEQFEKDKPEILGSIFNTLYKAMNVEFDLSAEKLPRMASSFIEMCRIASALGVSKEKFLEIYFGNIKTINKERANTPFVESILEYMRCKGRKVDSVLTSKLYLDVKATYPGEKNLLPNSPAAFTSRLKEERDTLEALGFSFLVDNTYVDGTHITIIKSKDHLKKIAETS